MKPVILTGHDLSIDQTVAVAREFVSAELASDAVGRMQRSRAVVEKLVEERVKVYGLTTGFGSKKNVFIEPEETKLLQRNLIQSHSCGLGEPLDEDVTRATILLRANTLALGLSGIRVEVVRAYLRMLDARVFPYIPCQGSLGASGDLAPLSHLALVLMGDPRGRIHKLSGTPHPIITAPSVADFEPSTPERLRELGLEPVVLEAKEGLALNNGTQLMAAIGLLTVADARRLLTSAEGTAAMSFEALKGVLTAFAPELHDARPHPGQGVTAANLRRYTAGSQILRIPLNMAHLNAASRLLGDATTHLTADPSPRAEDISEMIEQVEGHIDVLRDAPEAPIAGVEDRPIEALARYREALSPAKNQLLRAYRSMLSSKLTGDATMASRCLAEALGELEAAVPEMPRVQDAYSLRCTPQVLGAIHGVLDHVEGVLVIEANAATDNPLIFAPDVDAEGAALPIDDLDAYRRGLDTELCRRGVRSGGNFHGEPVAFAMDYLAIALSELANISERRTAHLVDGHLNMGLPSLLIHRAGLNSGFMIPQYTAASIVSENKSLAHPASVDSIPSCENTEDHVSMGTIGARKARRILINSLRVVAIEVFTAFQAQHFRRPLTAGPATKAITGLLESNGITFVAEDRPLYLDIETIVTLLQTGQIAAVLHKI